MLKRFLIFCVTLLVAPAVLAGPWDDIVKYGYGGVPATGVAQRVCTQTADDTTPSMAGCDILLTATDHSGSTAVTRLDDTLSGTDGIGDYEQRILIVGQAATNQTTIASGGNFVLSAAWTSPASGDNYVLELKTVYMTAAIASVADGGGGTSLDITSNAHGLVENQTVTLSGMSVSAYNGTYTINSVNVNDFNVTQTYSATATGTWAATRFDETSRHGGLLTLVGDLDMQDYDILNPLVIYQEAPTSDADPDDILVHPGHTFASGTQSPANLVLCGGADEKIFESTDYANSTGDTAVLTVVSCTAGVCSWTATTLTESTNWDCDVTSDNVCACALYTYLVANLPTGIASVSRSDGTCTDSKVFVQPDSNACTVTLSVSDVGGGGVWGTATNGVDGVVQVGGLGLRFGPADTDHAMIKPRAGVGDFDWLEFRLADDSAQTAAIGLRWCSASSSYCFGDASAIIRNYGYYAWSGRTEHRAPADGQDQQCDAAESQCFTLGASAANTAKLWGKDGSTDIGALIVTGDSSAAGGNTKGALTTVTSTTESVTFAGDPGDASKVTTGTAIPDGVYLSHVTTRVVTLGTNCAGYSIGDGADVDLWGADIAVADTTTSTSADATATWNKPALASQEITLSGTNGAGGAVNCFDLVVAITAHFSTGTAATSD